MDKLMKTFVNIVHSNKIIYEMSTDNKYIYTYNIKQIKNCKWNGYYIKLDKQEFAIGKPRFVDTMISPMSLYTNGHRYVLKAYIKHNFGHYVFRRMLKRYKVQIHFLHGELGSYSEWANILLPLDIAEDKLIEMVSLISKYNMLAYHVIADILPEDDNKLYNKIRTLMRKTDII